MKRVRLDALLLVFAIGAGYAAFSVPTPRSAAVIPSGLIGGAETDRPQSGSPEPAPSASRARPKTTPRPTARPVRVRPTERPLVDNATSVAPQSRVAIRATWYCGNGSRCTAGYPAGGLYAAISPDLRSWTGRLVRVRYGSRSVVVRIVDCDCATPHGIDLYSAAFGRLASLSAGEINVTLELLR